MHKFRALIWKAYKQRLRPISVTLIDFLGAISLIILYLFIKYIASTTNLVIKFEFGNSTEIIKHQRIINQNLISESPFDKFICKDVLYSSTSDTDGKELGIILEKECNLRLIHLRNENEVKTQLLNINKERIKHVSNSSLLQVENKTNCHVNNNNITFVTLGIVHLGHNSFKFYDTDWSFNPLLHQYYGLGSIYSEDTTVASSLGSGLFNIEKCVNNAHYKLVLSKTTSRPPSPPTSPKSPTSPTSPTSLTSTTTRTTATTKGPSKNQTQTQSPTTKRNNNSSTTKKPNRRRKRSDDDDDDEYILTKLPTIGNKDDINIQCNDNQKDCLLSSDNTSLTKKRNDNINSLREPTPEVIIQSYSGTGYSGMLTTICMILILSGYFGNSVAAVLRASEDMESHLHKYIRLCGINSAFYWITVWFVMIIHMFVQAFVISLLLSLPVTSKFSDPFEKGHLLLRLLLLFTYGVTLCSHGYFVGSLFSKVSSALLITCLLGVSYSVYPLMFLLEWSPYGYNQQYYIRLLLIFTNPVSCFQALMIAYVALYLNNSEYLDWNMLQLTTPGEQMYGWTVGYLWIVLALQGLFWFIATILIDEYHHSTTSRQFLTALYSDLGNCCRCIRSKKMAADDKTSQSFDKKSQPALDPNRICVSVSKITAFGPILLVPHNTDNVKKSTTTYFDNSVKTTNYTIGRVSPSLKEIKAKDVKASVTSVSNVTSKQQHQQSKLDTQKSLQVETVVRQSITWYSAQLKFENLKIKFNFNQITYVLGPTSMKELFFTTLLGLQVVDSGGVSFDDVLYERDDIFLARPHIGYLSYRDIFINEMTIFENLQFFGSLRDASYQTYESETTFVLSLLQLFKQKNSLPASLTIRKSRLVSLAAAAVGHTKFLLLVEPTIGLKLKQRNQVLNLLKKYKQIRSIVVDTSDIDEACAFADRLVLFKTNNGIDFDGDPTVLRSIMHCGYLVMFKYVGDESKFAANLQHLEQMTQNLLKEKKVGPLQNNLKSIYKSLIEKFGSRESAIKQTDDLTADELKKNATILTMFPTRKSMQALSKLIVMFNNHPVHSFRISELDYESLEDAIVVKLAKGCYPNLPPELVLSLCDRNKGNVNLSAHSSDSGSRQVLITEVMDADAESNKTPTNNIDSLNSGMFARKTSYAFCKELRRLIRWRFSSKNDTILLVACSVLAIVLVALCLFLEPYNLNISEKQAVEHSEPITSDFITQYYRNRIAYKFGKNHTAERKRITDSDVWPIGYTTYYGYMEKGEKVALENLTSIFRDETPTIITYNKARNVVGIAYEPAYPFSVIASIEVLYDSLYQRIYPRQVYETEHKVIRSYHHYVQPWHLIVRGFYNKRFVYGIGFGLAEGFAIGVLIVWPIKSKEEVGLRKFRFTYWFSVFLVDIIISTLVIVIYVLLFVCIAKIYSIKLLTFLYLTLFLYKLAIIPIIYLCSIATNNWMSAFSFVVFLQFVLVWIFAIHLESLLEWTLTRASGGYYMTSLILKLYPTNSLIVALTNISHINTINKLCPSVPAYMKTRHPTAEVTRYKTANDELMQLVHSCLENGKKGVNEIETLIESVLSILPTTLLLAVCILLYWPFLVLIERTFGAAARITNVRKASKNPLQLIARSNESFELQTWDRRKERLIGEYVRCLKDMKYVRLMSNNCLFLRVWFRPLSDQTVMGPQMKLIIRHVTKCGIPGEQVSVELQTTLQVFIKIGDGKTKINMNKAKFIESFLELQKQYNTVIHKFAIVNWRRETLYKILLHGHYNARAE